MKGTVREPGCAKLGRLRTILCDEMETEIVHHAIDMQQRFYGLTPCDIRKLSFQLMEMKKLHHPFNSTKQWPPRTSPIVVNSYFFLYMYVPICTWGCILGSKRVRFGKSLPKMHP